VPRRLLHAKTVRKWFADNRIQLLENWPSNSPDLNAIESCWNIMKKKVAAHRPTSEKDLKDVIKHVWATRSHQSTAKAGSQHAISNQCCIEE
jgi:transposase